MALPRGVVNPHPNFDLIARPYRWLEYLTFGPYLERCRFHFLDELANSRRALVLGDGDGRFTARLLASNTKITVDAVDSSARMLELLTARVSGLGPSAVNRLQIRHIDALAFRPDTPSYDLVVTHFFLDCLTDSDVASLLENLQPHLAPGTLWLVSEFSIPESQPAALFSRLVIGALYKTFGLLTGLETHHLPNFAATLSRRGFHLQLQESHLAELLTSEIWRLDSEPLKQRRP